MIIKSLFQEPRSYASAFNVSGRPSSFLSVLITHPIDDEMKRLTFPSYGQHIIAGLRSAVAHQEVPVVRHFRFRALSTAAQRAAVVPGVRSQITRIEQS